MKHTKHVILGLTAVSLLAAAPVGVATTAEAQHGIAQHMGQNADTLPAAVRQATARYLDAQNALDDGYMDTQNCVSGPEEGAMGSTSSS